MTDAPVHLRFDAFTHPDPTARTDAWRDAMSLSVDVAFTPEEAESFAGRLDFHPLGTVLLVEAETTAHTMIRDKSTIARTGEAHLILDVFPKGGFVGSVGGRRMTVGPGDGLLLDLKGTLHARMQATRFIGVIMPRRMFRAHARGAKAVHGLQLAATTPEARLLGSVLEGFLAQAPGLAGPRATALGDSLVGLITACIGAAGSTPSVRRVTQMPPIDAQPGLAQVRRYIERHAADPALDPERLCATFGLSRAALYRLLKPAGGVAELIRHRRAAIARRLLVHPGDLYGSLEAIARASGFSGASSLRRALLDIYGVPPSKLWGAPTEQADALGVHGTRIGALFDAGDPGNE